MVGPRKLFVRFTNRRNLRGGKYLVANPRYFRLRRWNFVGTTYNGRTGIAKLFINNRFVTRKNVGRFPLATQYSVRLGARIGDRRYFKGRIACVQIYNRELTPRQINRRRSLCFRGVKPGPRPGPRPSGRVCKARLDLAFIIDGSGSVGRGNFRRCLYFVRRLIASFKIGRGYTRVGVMVYSSRPRVIFNLRQYNNKRGMLNAVKRIRYRKGGTRTGYALNVARTAFFRNSRRRKACIIMTDGRSADKVIRPARALRRLGVQLIALGVGKRYSMSQLIQIAHNRRHVFTAHFKTLGSVATAIKRKVCKGLRPKPGPRPKPKPIPRPGPVPERPRAIFPLNRRFMANEKRGRARPGKIGKVAYARGPYGKRGGSIKFFGRRNSYIEFPNRRGRLDTRNSITLLAWIYHTGRGGPIFNYHPSNWGVHFWMVGPSTLFVRFNKRKGRASTAHVAVRGVRARSWHFVGATYNQRTGIAKLFVDRRFVTGRRIGRIKLATNYPVRMGVRKGDRRYFQGRIACMQVYSKALTARQIRNSKKLCYKRRPKPRPRPLPKPIRPAGRVCRARLDLGFLVDGSGSVNRRNFRRVLHFVKKMIASFKVGARGVRIAVIIYSSHPRLLFNFGNYKRRNMYRRIDRARYPGRGTKTGYALMYANSVIFRGGNRRKACILLTDGKSMDSVAGPAMALRRKGVYIIAVGIGRAVSNLQLKQIASGGKRRLVFNAHFKTLTGMARIIKKKVCRAANRPRPKPRPKPGPKPKPKPMPPTLIHPLAVFPLHERYRGKEKNNKNPQGILVGVRPAPGPDRKPGSAYRFFGRANSYIEIPNKGRIDPRRSITIMAWIKNQGASGPIFNYMPNGWGVHFWMVGPRTLFVRYTKRGKRASTPALASRTVRLNKWQLVATTYNYRTGVAKLFVQNRFVAKKRIGKFRLATNYPVRVGARIRDRRYFRGSISCIQVYKKALTAAQIRRRKKMCFGIAPRPPPRPKPGPKPGPRPKPPRPICPPRGRVCTARIDLAFLIDGSGSIEHYGKGNFKRLLMFVKHMIANFIVSKRYTRIAIGLYSTTPHKIYGFRQRQDRKSVYKAINGIRYPRAGTKTGKALWFMLRNVFRGARSRRLLIVLTDGKSQDSVAQAAIALRRKRVQIFAVGLGRRYNTNQLRQIAGSRRNVFTASFRLLNRLIRAIKQKACRRRPIICPPKRRPYIRIGCYKDRRNRAVGRMAASFRGRGRRAIYLCYLIARRRGYAVFAIQYGGQCFTGPRAHRTYMRYGRSRRCKNGLGGPYANSVYKIRRRRPQPVPRVRPRAIYPLTKIYGKREKKSRNRPARFSKVRFAPGPLGKPGRSIQFYGRPDSYVVLPNRKGGRLDTGKSITLLAYVLHQGRAGPIIQYHPGAWGVHLWMISPTKLFVRFTKRRGLRFTKYLISTRYFKRGRFNWVGATYDRRTGIAKLFINKRFVARQRIGRIYLSTQYPVRLGARRGDRRYFRGRIACVQFYDRALTARQILKSRRRCFRPRGPVQPSGVYPLNKKSRGRDTSGRRNPSATLVNVKPARGPQRRPGGAIRFPGRPVGFVKIPNRGRLDAKGGDLTYMAWVYPTGRPGTIISHGLTVGVDKYRRLTLRFTPLRARIYLRPIISRRRLPKRRWNLVVVTYRKRTRVSSLYVNSRLVLRKKFGKYRLNTRAPVYIGGRPRARTGFSGRIACVQFFKATLTRRQISRNSRRCFRKKPLPPVRVPRPIGMYPLDKKNRGRDTSGRRNPPGTFVNVKPAPGPQRRPGGAIRFPGKPVGYIRIPNRGRLDTKGGDLTYMAWVYPTGRPGTIISHGLAVGIDKYRRLTLRFTPLRSRIYLRPIISRRRLPIRRWSYVTVTYRKRTRVSSLYVNSRLVLRKKFGKYRLNTRAPVYIGGRPRARTGFSGRIACVQFFKATLTRRQMYRRSKRCFRKKPIRPGGKVCRSKIDIGVLIDGSGSIEHYGRGNFKRMLKFVKALVNSFSVCKRRARIGVVLYSTRPYGIFRFGRYCSKHSIFRAIDRIRYPRKGTKTGKALTYTRRYLFRHARKRAKKVLVVLTDGKSQDSVRRPARQLRLMGVEVFAVGIGRKYSARHLNEIATDRRHIYTAGFRNLFSLVRVLKTKACRKGPLRPGPRPIKPVERATYPLNKKYRNREKSGKNGRATFRGVRYVPGPHGARGGALQFYGKPNSYVQIPNGKGGRLDTPKSTTLLAWVLNQGRSGPIIHYHPGAWGVHLWMISPTTLFVRFTNRRGLRFTHHLASRRYFRKGRWNLVSATYNYRTGTAKLFINYKFVAVRRIGRITLATNYPIRLGARLGDRRYFKGRIACVKIFAKALLAREIRWAGKSCIKRRRKPRPGPRNVRPLAIYPLNRRKGYKEALRRGPTARGVGVRFAPGPDRRPRGSLFFFGKPNSYIEIQNRAGGPLDAGRRGGSITLAAWVYNRGAAGPIIHYNPKGWGVHLWYVTSKTLFVRFTRRRSLRFTPALATRRNVRTGWNFVAATYRRRTGTARLFVNNRFVAGKRIGRIRLATNYPVRLGARKGDRRYFKGQIACVQFYNRALTARQLRRQSRLCIRGRGPTPRPRPKPVRLRIRYLGCYRDRSRRAVGRKIANLHRFGRRAITKCAMLAYRRRFKIFGLENGGECYASNNLKYGRYGRTRGCRNGLGGRWKINVYFIVRGSVKPGPVRPKPGGRVCRKRVDLGFLIDGSGSIEKAGKGNFKRILKFVRDMVSSFVISPRSTRVGIVLYSTNTYPIFGFRRYRNRRQLLRAIRGIRYPRGGTRTGRALFYTLKYLFARARRNVLKVLMVLTDGKSQDSVSGPANNLRRAGVEVFAIGVGKSYKIKQLMNIASRRKSRHVFTVHFRNLRSVVRVIKSRICRARRPRPVVWHYKWVGCFKDRRRRAVGRMIASYRGHKNAVRKCALLAYRKGFGLFAVQYGGQCFAGRRSKYYRYGRSRKCKGGKGGSWANDVYRIKKGPYRPRPGPAPRPRPGPHRIRPRVVYPLNRLYGKREKRRRSRPAVFSRVRFAPGPFKRPGASVQFAGHSTSYIELPNYRGRLDTVNSITIMAWVNHVGRAGPILNYDRKAWGVHFWMVTAKTLFVRFTKRGSQKSTPAIVAYMRPKRWHLVAATYNQRSGVARLFVDRKFVAAKSIGRIRLATNYPARLGARVGDSRYFRGRIACFQLFDRALTARQILSRRRACVRRGPRPHPRPRPGPIPRPSGRVCRKRLDLAFLIDGSGSIEHYGRGNFKRCLYFVKKMIASFHVSPRHVRVAVVLFSSRPHLIFDFKRYRNKVSAIKAVNRIRYPRGGTRTGRALRFVKRRLFRGRSRRRRCLIVMTDGKSQDRVRGPANVLKRSGVEIIALGIGRKYVMKQLRHTASTRRHVFKAPFRYLRAIVLHIKRKVCRRGPRIIGPGGIRPRPRPKLTRYQFLGCFKDKRKRAMPKRLIRLRGRHRRSLVNRCLRIALRKGYQVFGVQNNNECWSGRYAYKTYGKYGRSRKCRWYTGGRWANDVYRIGVGKYRPNRKKVYHYRFAGCWKDKRKRALRTRLGTFRGRNAIRRCFMKALRKGLRVFSLQNRNECWADRTVLRYKKYGRSRRCRKWRGGPFSNDVYLIGTGRYRPRPRPRPGPRSRPGKVKRYHYKSLGCYKDRRKRAMKRLLYRGGARKGKLIHLCFLRALKKGHRVFGVENQNECWSGRRAHKTYSKYGRSRRCRNWTGGRWALNVYRIGTGVYIPRRPKVPKGYKKPTRNIYHYRFVGCWRDKPRRAIRKFLGKVHGRGAIMQCFRRALRRGFKTFALQAGSECRGAKSTRRYRMYRRARNCKRWRGGAWANDVYRIGRGPYRPRPRPKKLRLRISRKFRGRRRFRRRRRKKYYRRKRKPSNVSDQPAFFSPDHSQPDSINYQLNDQSKSQGMPAENAQPTDSMNSVKPANVDKPPSVAESAPTTTGEKEPDAVSLTDIDPEPATDGAEVFGIDTPGIQRSKIVPNGYATADYYWPFDVSVKSASPDVVHKQMAELQNGALVQNTPERGAVAESSKAGAWISLGDFKGKCFSDPATCKHKGMTVSSWIKISKNSLQDKSSSYLISSGGQTTKARGFALLHLNNQFILILSTKDKQWKLEVPALPDDWFNLAFTWEKQGVLKLYVNGQPVTSATPMSVSRPQDSFTEVVLGRPNNSLKPQYMLPMDLDNLALWERALSEQELKSLFAEATPKAQKITAKAPKPTKEDKSKLKLETKN